MMVTFIKDSEVHCFVAAPGPGSLKGALVALGGVCRCCEICEVTLASGSRCTGTPC